MKTTTMKVRMNGPRKELRMSLSIFFNQANRYPNLIKNKATISC